MLTRPPVISRKRAAVAVAVAAPMALSPAVAGATGGTYASDPASIRSVSCTSACAGLDTARPGSTVRVRGRDMASVRRVVFLGGRGPRDDTAARIRARRAGSVDVLVPARAISGRLRAINADGARSRASRATVAVQRGSATAQSGPVEARAVGRTVFLDAERPARLQVMVRQSTAMDLDVVLVRLGDGAVVAAWPLGAVPAGATREVRWDGLAGGEASPPGRYEFRVLDGGAAVGSDAFTLLDHRFPVRGDHGYGEFAAGFGGGRGHEGQDVFAACGTRLVAARGGTVKLKRFQERAGHYVVIDGEHTGVDYAYMHLQAASPVEKGDRVRTGQLIGRVGDTGRASGCHLHFEMWSAPGWYTGGAPFDPLPHLQAWDATS